eukprot:symbB.v1.2.030489.t1/scaffold3434.1/size111337/14
MCLAKGAAFALLAACSHFPVASALDAVQEDCVADQGLHFVQSVSEKRRSLHQVSDVPFASLVELEPSSEGFPQLKQVMALAQTKVQTKVGEAPYFIIAVAVGGFALSLLSICVSLVFVKGVAQDTHRDGSASGLLAQRLRAMGIGQPKSPWPHHTYQSYQPDKVGPSSWHFSGERARDSCDQVKIMVSRPLEGGRVGLNLSEDDLVVNNFGDPKAPEFGFQIGDRIVQVNAIPVFQESDFRFVMKDALRHHATTGEPIIFEVIRPARKPMAMPPAGYDANAAQPATSPAVMRTILPNKEDFQDITGEWCYGTSDAGQFSYFVRKVGDALSFEQTLPNGQKVTGMLQPEDLQSPWLRSELKSAGGLFGELRIHYDPEEQVLVSQVRPTGRQKWDDERVAKRVGS